MRGFTLIETLIYIALLGLLMTGALLGALSLVQSTSRTTSATIAQEEGSFVMRKLEWAMAGMTSAPTTVDNGCSDTISITKTGAPYPMRFRLSSGAIQMCEDSSCTYIPLTSSSVTATCLAVSPIAASGGGPSGVTVTATLQQKTSTPNPKSYDFTVTRYLRI